MAKKKCYYDLLEVDPLATPLELKKAYRRKALELHPDKNPHRITECTALFADIQAAYEVLSDPHERAWYDSHRDSILRGGDPASDSSTSGLTADVLMKWFDRSCYNGFGDDPRGFYAVYRDVFDQVLREEHEALEFDSEALSNIELKDVSFGYSSSSYDKVFMTRDREETSIKEFYAIMQTFSTCKSFRCGGSRNLRWCDKYRLSDAPDRRIRRLMEKDNNKEREKARREYSQQVCDLVAFVKKRDPRFIAYKANMKEKQSKALEQEKAKKKQEAIERAENAETYQEQAWVGGESEVVVETDKYGVEYLTTRSTIEKKSVGDSVMEDDYVEDDFFCVLCGKQFNTSSQKHLKLAEQLRREMLKDEYYFDDTLSDVTDKRNSSNESLAGGELHASVMDELADELNNIDVNDDSDLPSDIIDGSERVVIDPPISKSGKGKKSKKKKISAALPIPAISDEEYTKNSEVPAVTPSQPEVKLDSDSDIDWSGNKSKKSKKKSKTAPSKGVAGAKGKDPASSSDLACNVCRESFASKTKLFDHIRATGHAVAVSEKKRKNK